MLKNMRKSIQKVKLNIEHKVYEGNFKYTLLQEYFYINIDIYYFKYMHMFN